MNTVNVVKKGSPEFKAASQKYIELLCQSTHKEIIMMGEHQNFETGKTEYIGLTSQKIKDANLPMPFGCPDLFVHPFFEKKQLKSVAWFCNRLGCLCSCCREDFTKPTEEYPKYCPDPFEEYCLEDEEWEAEW